MPNNGLAWMNYMKWALTECQQEVYKFDIFCFVKK